MTESGEPESTPGGTDEPKGPLVKKVRKRVLVGPKRSPRPAAEVIERVTPSKATPKKSGPIEHADVRRVDKEARKELAEIQAGRRSFLKKAAIGAGLVALGAGLGFGGGYVSGTGFGGQTVITDTEIAARVIAGVRVATEFIPTPVPAGTDTDPYPGSAIQAALNDGVAVYIPSGTWKLTSTIRRGVDNVTILGAGRSTKLVLDGVTAAISAGTQTGWLIADLATDAGGVDISASSQTRVTEVWVNGVLTDNRPIAVGAGGSGGFYGVRAADYVTSGDGSASNPFNSSAIQNAINAVGSGGVVFVKAGVWGQSGEGRITVRGKKILIVGEETELDQFSNTGSPNWIPFVGTVVRAGFDCYYPTDFENLSIMPQPGADNSAPGVKYILDPTDPGLANIYLWLGGFLIKNVLFMRCSPAIWMTGQNFGTTGATWQIWKARIEDVFASQGGTVLKVDKGDSTPTPSFECSILHLSANSAGNAPSARAVNIDIGNWRGFASGILLEGCSSGSDYCWYSRGAGSYGGLIIQDVFFGDGSFAAKDAYIQGGRGLIVRNLHFKKGLDIDGSGVYQTSLQSNGTGSVTVLNGQELTIEEAPLGSGLPIGSISAIPGKEGTINIKRIYPVGFIGSTTPTGSPYTYTNIDYQVENVIVVGGSVTDVTRAGQSTGGERSHCLRPGDSIVITYTSAPTIKRFSVSSV